MTTKLEPMLWLSDARGIYIPRDFVNSFADWAYVKNVTDEQRDVLAAGPEQEFYWDVWNEVLDSAIIEDQSGNRFSVWQDSDCWLIPEGMEWNDESNFWCWPEAA